MTAPVNVREQGDSIATRLWLGTRRYALLIVVPMAVLTMLGFAVGRDPKSGKYEASAVVVASDLKTRPEGLPRFAELVFTSGEVARAAAISLPYPAVDLIPERANLETAENSPVLEIVATDGDPLTAAQIANKVAEAFVAELNQPGPTFATFVIQSTAQVPVAPLPATSGIVATAVGLIAGAILGLGLVMTVLLIRRPVLTAGDVAAATNAAVLATLRLPRRRDLRVAAPPGTAAVARRLFPDRAGMCGLIGGGSATARSQVSVLVADVLAPSGPVHLVTEAADEAARALPAESVTVTRDIPSGRVWASAPVIIDGPSEYDLPALYPPNARLALVVEAGSPAARVSTLASEFLPGELTGVVLVQRRWGWGLRRTRAPRRSTRRSPAAPAAPVASSPNGAPERDRGREPEREARPQPSR